MISDEAFDEIKEYILDSVGSGINYTGSFDGIGEQEAIEALISDGKLRKLYVMGGFLSKLERVMIPA